MNPAGGPTAAFEPRRFGPYLLVAELARDALGSVYRALRLSADRAFARLRIFDSPELSEDAVLDAIEQNGEVHSFLKNPTIARGVQMDGVDGTPFLAWDEPSGRTLDALLARSRETRQPIPFEHAILLVEKVATALDHAYNTMIDGERVLHGLVCPGLISVSDDGEVRLAGFGLATGFFPSFGKERFAREVGPYLAPEERAERAVGRNSDVFSAGAILFELLTGRVPSADDPAGELRGSAAPRLAPELLEVLRMCLAPSDSRYQTAGDLRRELGKLLFSGPYAPSTFNFAFFLDGLFAAEIQAENAARATEALLDDASIPEPAARSASSRSSPAEISAGSGSGGAAGRGPLVFGSAALLAAAIAGTALLFLRRPAPSATHALPVAKRIARAATPTPAPALEAAAATSAMSESEFKDEVSRRVAEELKKIREEMSRVKSAAPTPEPAPNPAAAAVDSSPARAPSPVSVSSLKASAAAIEPTAIPVPTSSPEPARVAAVEPPASSEALPAEEPPKILRIVKPIYPPLALKARIGGTVVLRVLVSESGAPLEVHVVQGAAAGLSDSAVSAVRRWKFTPAHRGTAAIAAWTTIPIPFEP